MSKDYQRSASDDYFQAPNKALQLTATRYAGCPQLSLVVMGRLMAVPEGAYRERNLLQGPLDRD